MSEQSCPRPPAPVDPSLPRTQGYDEAVAVLRSTSFVSADVYIENSEILGGTILASDGDRHRHLKRLEGRLFTPALLASYEKQVLAPVINREIRRATSRTVGDSADVSVDLVALTRRMALTVSARVVGLDDVNDERIDQLTEILSLLGDALLIQWVERDHRAVLREAVQAKAIFWEDFVEPALATRRVLLQEGDLAEDDLLSVILHDEELDWANDEILKEAILYLAAAAFTTATAVTHSAAELFEWLTRHPTERARVRNLDFLRVCAMESLRVHPGRHVLIRTAERPTSMPSGALINQGETVLVDCFKANMDPMIYGADVSRFDPDRKTRTGSLRYGLSFGAGRHQCLGRPLVLGLEADDGTWARDGTVALILQALFAAGMTPDSNDSPRRPESVHDRYEYFPIRFEHQSTAGPGARP